MAYHLRLTKRVQTIIRNRLGKEPSCYVCEKEFEVNDELLSVPEINSPCDRKYYCPQCYMAKQRE